LLTEIENGAVSGEKAHRWLGWAQAVICCRGGASLDELKRINTGVTVFALRDNQIPLGTQQHNQTQDNGAT
jgi:hypothetical protein